MLECCKLNRAVEWSYFKQAICACLLRTRSVYERWHYSDKFPSLFVQILRANEYKETFLAILAYTAAHNFCASEETIGKIHAFRGKERHFLETFKQEKRL